MTKTIEEMVQELDEKFDGFYRFFERAQNLCGARGQTSVCFCTWSGRNLIFSVQSTKYYEGLKVEKRSQRDFYKELASCKEVINADLVLDECITRAHNYFITQGGEL